MTKLLHLRQLRVFEANFLALEASSGTYMICNLTMRHGCGGGI